MNKARIMAVQAETGSICPYDEDIEKVPEKITFDDPRMWCIEL